MGRVGYKETKVGWIPEDWENLKAHKIAKLVAGGTPSTMVTKYWGGEILWMRSGDLNIKRIYDVEGRITDEGMKNSSAILVPKHSVLIGLAGQGKTRGTVAINEVRLTTNQSVAAFIPNKEHLNYLYLYYELESRYNEIRKMSTGDGGRGGLNLNILKNLKIILPPLSEQYKIGEILNIWDQAINLMSRQIEAKQRLKKALMQQLLTGRKRFPEFKDDWKVIKLGKLFTERNENNSSLDLLSITAETGVVPRDEVGRKDISNIDKSKYKVIKPGDIGYNTMRMWQGRSAVSRLIGIVSPAYTIVTPIKNQNVDFYGYLFKLSRIIDLFFRYSQGLVSDTLSLKFPHFSKINVCIPDCKEQEYIANILLDLDKEVAILTKKLALLKRQKQGLMQKLLTGEVRVNVN